MYGIGATKAGTSWLFDQLARHPDCHLRGLKEIHYFDLAEAGGFAYRQKSLARAAARHRPGKGGGDSRLAAIRDWQDTFGTGTADDGAYLAYLNRGRQGQPVIGDVTPAYSMLTEETYRRMADLAPVTRFIYIMRDPVERVWSHLRMTAKRAAKVGGDVAQLLQDQAAQVLAGAHEGIARRSDYARTVQALDAAVPQASILYLFFETLFSSRTAERIASFLGISPFEGRYDEVVHKGTAMDFDPDLRARLRAHLDPQYQFVTARFSGQVPDSWALA
jgi:hypothetical protein